MRRIAVLVLCMAACVPGQRGYGLFEAALTTAAILSTLPPPAPRVTVVPAPREGYAWQPGYWTRDDDTWVWLDGTWAVESADLEWSAPHWEQVGVALWSLVPGQWVE